MNRQRVAGYLFNLVIYTHEKRRHKYFYGLVRSFVKKFPSRVIFIDGDKNATQDYLKTTDNPCSAGEVCDRLTISASQSRLHEVPFVILPHLVPDLPIYVIWGQNPTTENTILSSLEKLASRLVFDSECVENLKGFAQKMLGKVESSTIDLMDVSWAAISSWRDAMAKTFESEEQIHQLRNCRRVRVKYNNVQSPFFEHLAIQAIYFQSWLAAQLDWKYDSVSYDGDITTIRYSNRTGTTELTLYPQERTSLTHGTIFEIEFLTSEDLSVIFSLAEKQSKILVYFSSPEKCELPLALPFHDSEKGGNAMKELFYYRASDHYSHMLQMLSKVDWKQF